jgi:hypothetical protein
MLSPSQRLERRPIPSMTGSQNAEARGGHGLTHVYASRHQSIRRNMPHGSYLKRRLTRSGRKCMGICSARNRRPSTAP